MDIQVDQIASRAKKASRELATLSTTRKNAVLLQIARLLEQERTWLQQENQKDLEAGRAADMSDAMLNRLELSDDVIASTVKGLHELVNLKDPVGSIDHMTRRPNGMLVGRMRIPLGVIMMIYESRPNVTVDAAALCLKTGNGVILRGGSEAIHSNRALATLLKRALEEQGINGDAIQVVSVTDRSVITRLLHEEDNIDLVIPRGGEGLIRNVMENSRIPVLKHYKGVCHLYVDKAADLDKTIPVILNAKTQRPGTCNTLEGLLIHEKVAADFIPRIAEKLAEAGVEIRGCRKSCALSEKIVPAAESDWGKEFLALIISVKVVADYDEARAYIDRYGSHHTEAIMTEDYEMAQRFLSEIDASAVMVNASTRFNDGGELGLGAEIGISTTKLHSYGPMGLEELTTRKFIVMGTGQVRQ